MQTGTPPANLQERLHDLMPHDRRRLRRRLDGVRKVRGDEARQKVLNEIAAEVAAAQARLDRRRDGVPRISYPPALPVSQRKDEIGAAIRDHQVVVLAGETGSGKTTQLPKICLELGRGVRGMIGHTQPRRLAARTVAERIAEELATPLGGAVGYKVRFTDRVAEETLVKLMTDGILLAELAQDRDLLQYDTLIIDEAHERSLNIDFILGYLKQLLPRRPDLKVVITSATIDPERFARHFGGAPIIEVSGRTYPVEVRYRSIDDTAQREDRSLRGPQSQADDTDQIDAIGAAVNELSAAGPGDILVFLSGEREIRDTAEALRRTRLRDTEILPLYARLSTAEQHRVFQPHPGRRIVLATNVAETSLTVPGIKYVVDPGTARISRYSRRLKVQRLPIEPVSQASANQRKGRCGRTSDGICIRLYSEPDFVARPEFTDPEVLRTNLASVILQMTALGLGDVAAFPFVDPPDRRNIADGMQLLEELGALEPARPDRPDRRLTPLGRKLAQLPVDPRLGRMVLEAERNGCTREVMAIAAALSIQDPRERPLDRQQAADEQHARFADEHSDFTGILNLWQYVQERQKTLSSAGFRRRCRTEFLNFQRLREWQDIYGQLREVARDLSIPLNTAPAEPDAVHQSLLAGSLSYIGLRDGEKHEYLGARGARFAINPGSGLFKKQPRWVMTAGLVETTRLWARAGARIEPEWIEPLAGHLVKRAYSEPHWDSDRGAVMAYETVALYGTPIVTQRPVNYGRIDPSLSRELFIRHALVEGDWETTHPFLEANRRLVEQVEELEHRTRRRDILVDDEQLFDFYDRRIGPDVVSARHFDTWWKKTRATQPDLLTFSMSMLVAEGKGGVSEAEYPDFWEQDGPRLGLTYQFEPGTDADGVTVHVPLALLGRVSAEDFAWQVPGLRKELVTALIRALPKPVRRHLVPVPEFADAVLARIVPRQEPLLDALERELRQLGGVVIPRDAWQLDRLPAHLRVTFRVEDDNGEPLAEDKDLAAVRSRLKERTQAALSAASAGVERRGLRAWDFGGLPQRYEVSRGGYPTTLYPALIDEGDSVAIRVFETESEQRRAMWQGIRRLLVLTVPAPVRLVNARLSNEAKLALSRNPHRNAADLMDDCLTCAVDTLLARAGGPVWTEAGFAALRDNVRAHLADTLFEIVTQGRHILAAAHAVQQRLATAKGPAPALADIRAQLAGLVYRGFVTATGSAHLGDVPRYLRAIERRLDKLAEDPRRDAERMQRIQQVQQEYAELSAQARDPQAFRDIRWMIEELRVSYFAQALGTAYPVSDKRIYRAMDELAS